MLINELPTEILSQILINITDMEKVAYECMLVCKLWRRQIVSVFYGDLIIERISHEQFIQLAQQEIYNNGDKIGDFVKKLTFDDRQKILLSQKDFERLIDALPSLEIIQFEPTTLKRTIQYIEYLSKFASRTQLREVSGIRYIPEKININRLAQLCYSINDQLKHQLVTLKLFHTGDKFQQDGCQDILDYIKDFAHLKHLTIENTKKEHGAREGLDVSSVLDACNNNLNFFNLQSAFSWYITASTHRYHPNLTSLTLKLPDFTQDHLKYLIEYVPYLKTFYLTIEFGDNRFLNSYTSLDPVVSSKFTQYLKGLQLFDCVSNNYGSFSFDKDAYWKTLQELYSNQICNLAITFEYEDTPTETLFHDKVKWYLECQYEDWELDDVGRPFDFLNLNSIFVEYDVESLLQTTGIQNDTSMSDVLDFAVSERRIQAHIAMDDRQIVLCSEPVEDAFPALHVFPTDQAPIKYAFFEKVYLNSHLLDKISTYYPLIESMKLVNCEIEEEEDDEDDDENEEGTDEEEDDDEDEYDEEEDDEEEDDEEDDDDENEDMAQVIDLQMFTNLQHLILAFDDMVKKDSSLCFHWNNGGQETIYIYDRSINEHALFSTEDTDDTPEDASVVKIITVKLKGLTFLRCRKELEILCK